MSETDIKIGDRVTVHAEGGEWTVHQIDRDMAGNAVALIGRLVVTQAPMRMRWMHVPLADCARVR